MQQIIGFPHEFVGFMYVWEMSAFMQSWGQLVANLSSPWGHVGPTLGHLGLNFVHIGANLGTNEAILAPTWGLMKPSGH